MLISSVILVLANLPYTATSDPPLNVNVFSTPIPTGAPFTPEEPTTLALALVGIAIVAAYLAITRRVWQRVARQVSVGPARAGAPRTNTPTREAA